MVTGQNPTWLTRETSLLPRPRMPSASWLKILEFRVLWFKGHLVDEGDLAVAQAQNAVRLLFKILDSRVLWF